MSDKRSIEAAFAKANVPLEITERSVNRRLIRGGGQIVQMGIVSDRRGNEMPAYRLVGYFEAEEFSKHLESVLEAD